MKKLYILLFSAILFTSCKPRLITQGITDKKSNYVVTTAGKQIDLPSITIQNKTVISGADKYPLTSLSAIKSGQAYYGVQNGQALDGVYYGNIMLLRTLAGYWHTTNQYGVHQSSQASFDYYLQRKGQSAIVKMTGSNLVDYVRDNPIALRKARAGRIYHTAAVISAATFIGGLACVFLPHDNPIRTPAVTVGLFSFPVFFISTPIGNHKKFKAIRVYNRYR